MAELTCDDIREAAAELALGVLPRPQRNLVAAHLLGCRVCRDEVAALTEIATRLLDMVPGTEPPLGFDRAVLLRVKPRRRTRTVATAIAAAVIICLLLAGSVLDITGRSHPAVTPPGLVGIFRENGVPVGTLATGGHPLWVSVSVRGVAMSGPVSCQLVGGRGSVETLGLFDLVHGSGTWAAPDPGGIGRHQQARLVDRAGQVIATAVWR
jgi:predicted anti-sigma-YlaC factor YlaD